MKKQHIYLGADHGGFALKEEIKKHLLDEKYKVEDVGTFDEGSVDYPDFARMVGYQVEHDDQSFGILVCGTGIGMSIAANKIQGIRAVVATEPIMAEMSRKHNDANVLCLGGRVLKSAQAKKLVDIFVGTDFEGDERHKRRIAKLEGGCCGGHCH